MIKETSSFVDLSLSLVEKAIEALVHISVILLEI